MRKFISLPIRFGGLGVQTFVRHVFSTMYLLYRPPNLKWTLSLCKSENHLHKCDFSRLPSVAISLLQKTPFKQLKQSLSGHECHKLIKLESLAKTGETKTGEKYSSVIRTEISFSLLRSTTTAMRGSRNVRGFL